MRAHESFDATSMTRLSLSLLAALLFFVRPAGAWPTTPEDWAKLPEYCHARSENAPGYSKAAGELWSKRLGPNFINIHHYCSGLDHVNDAYATTDPKVQREELEASLGSFQYMIDNLGGRPEDFPLMPEIYFNMGRSLAELKRYPAAASYFEKAVRLNPRFVPAYQALAGLYGKAGQKDTARMILDYGLKANPGNPALVKALERVK